MMKKYAFLIFIVLLAAGLFAVSYFMDGDTAEVIYSPRTDLTKPAPSAAAEEVTNTVIKRTHLVYFYDDSEVFHIKPDCSGMGEIQGRPCGQALDMGMRPCSICMKYYLIQ